MLAVVLGLGMRGCGVLIEELAGDAFDWAVFALPSRWLLLAGVAVVHAVEAKKPTTTSKRVKFQRLNLIRFSPVLERTAQIPRLTKRGRGSVLSSEYKP